MGLILKTLLGASIREETSFARKKTVLKGLEQGDKKPSETNRNPFMGGLPLLLGIPRRAAVSSVFQPAELI